MGLYSFFALDWSLDGGVSRGAKTLDILKPGWFKLVNTGKLNMLSGDNCVLGQVFCKEAIALYTNGYTYGRQLVASEVPHTNGAFASPLAIPYWTKEIAQRLKAERVQQAPLPTEALVEVVGIMGKAKKAVVSVTAAIVSLFGG